MTLNEEAGRTLRSTSNQSSEPCEVAQYPQPKQTQTSRDAHFCYQNTIPNNNHFY